MSIQERILLFIIGWGVIMGGIFVNRVFDWDLLFPHNQFDHLFNLIMFGFER